MPGAPRRILIVDNDQDVLITLERILEGEGYQTTTAWSAHEALDLCARFDFDLLLVNEYISDVDANSLLLDLKQRQPKASRLVMFGRPDVRRKPPTHAVSPSVCKWEHGEVKAQVRTHLASA